MSKKKQNFATLTWDDLESWAGEKIVSRGRSYLKNVRQLSQMPTGDLLAWVDGSKRYATHIWITPKGELKSTCSCPYDWGDCKHAVATLLVYLKMEKSGTPVPKAVSNDPRLKIATSETCADYEDDYDVRSTEEGNDQNLHIPPNESLRVYLQSFNKDKLIDYLLEISGRYPEVYKEIIDQESLSTGNITKLVASMRSEIREITSEEAWSNYWSGESHLPDYSSLQKKLNHLLQAGHANEVVELGQELFNLGSDQVAHSHDDGYTAIALGNCMEIFFDALTQSSLKPQEQLLTAIQTYLSDEYSILDEVDFFFDKKNYSKKDWGAVAEDLQTRLESLPESEQKDSFIQEYYRKAIIDWIIIALEKSGRHSEIIPLLKREIPLTNCYGELVDRLIAASNTAEARTWAEEGYKKTISSYQGVAGEMVKKLYIIARKEKDYHLAAAYKALDFFSHEHFNYFTELKKATKAAKLWPQVRESILHYLETGKLKEWPLPETGLKVPVRRKHQSFPNHSLLIEIAIEEKRIDDVVRWYEAIPKKNTLYFHSDIDEKVADAVQGNYPDLSLQIWKRFAESHISRVKPAAYKDAAVYLRKTEKLYQKGNRQTEWQRYLSSLKTTHKAKRRLMQVLDSLESKRIIDD
jgi:uncharacterized Zn finger protein